MLAARLKRNGAMLLKLVEAMSDEYSNLCKSKDKNDTQEKGLVASDDQSMTSLRNFLSHIISKKSLEEIESSKKWDESADGHVRNVIKSFFSDLDKTWDNTPTGIWAVVGLQQRREKIQDYLSSLLTVYGIDTEAQKAKQTTIKGAACLLDYAGMIGAIPTADTEEESGYNARIKGIQGKHSGIFYNTIGFAVCPKKEAATKDLLTDRVKQYPVLELLEAEKKSFYRGAEAVESTISATEGLAPLQQFSHLTDSLERARVQYDNIKTLVACLTQIKEGSDAHKAVTLMLGVIVEDMLIESFPTVIIQGKPQSTRTVCTIRNKAYSSGCESEQEIYTQILKQVLAEGSKQVSKDGKGISLDDGTLHQQAAWWQTCEQKIFTPHVLMGKLLQNPESVDLNQLLGTIERISPVSGEVSGACLSTMAGMMAIVQNASTRVTEPVVWNDKGRESMKRQQARALQQLCVDAYLSPLNLEKSGLAFQEVFTSIVNSDQKTIKVYHDFFKGQRDFQEAYKPYADSIILDKETDEHTRQNIETIVLDAPKKSDGALQAIGDIIKDTNKWLSDRRTHHQTEKTTDTVVSTAGSVELNPASSDERSIRQDVSHTPSSRGVEDKSNGVQVLQPKVPAIEKILVDDRPNTATPIIKIVYTNADRFNKLNDLQAILQQAYNKNVLNRWGGANRWSIPNLAAATSCVVCVGMAGWSWIAGDMIGLILNIATAISVLWYTKNAYQNAVAKLQKIPAVHLGKLSKQGVITGELEHKNWAWNKPHQKQPKRGFSIKSFLGYAAMLTPCLVIMAFILKAKGWIALGGFGQSTLSGLARVAPIQAMQIPRHMGQISKVLGGSNIMKDAVRSPSLH